MSRILHLGLGRFHRAHQAVYFSRLGPEWTISAWSMRSPAEADSFPPEGYDVVVPGQPPERVRSIVETGYPPRDREKWEKAWTAPELEIVTLTVTEKGYAEPLFAQLAAALQLRRSAHLKDPVLLSCDNLRSNGQRLREGLEQQGLSDLCCPNSVVDRIVPAGQDPRTIITEAFSQWVIETNWPHPPLEKVGVHWVEEAAPYEEMKLGLLNLAHSYLAYAGLLQGHQFVHQAMADSQLAQALVDLQAEAGAQLQGLQPREVADYASHVRERFANADLPHALAQIAMDGSLKLPQRLFPLLRRARDHGDPHQALQQVLHSWLAFAYSGPLQDPIETHIAAWRQLPLPDFGQRVLQLLGSDC